MLRIGGTGTRYGMSPFQKETARKLFWEWMKEHRYLEFHHGDCIGADYDMHVIAREVGCFIVVHPPSDARNRAWCLGDELRPPRDYMIRNKLIVDETTRLIAAPQGDVEELRSGTWSAIRYARKTDKKVFRLLRKP